MKIAHIERQRSWTGQVNRVYRLMIGFKERGHDVVLITHPGSEIGKRSEQAGITVEELPLFGSSMFFSIPKAVDRLTNEHVDILHGHGARDHQAAIGIANWLEIPVLFRTKHNHTKFHSGMLSRIPYRLTTHIVTVSRYVRNQLIQDGLLPKKITAIPSAVNVNEFQPDPPDAVPRDEVGIPEDHLVIGTLSSLHIRKGIEEILKATARLVETDLKDRLTLLLAGPNADKWKELIEQLDLEPYVVCTGFVDDPSRYLSLFDVFLHPSRQEALGTAVIEAMSAGRPVVATRTGGQFETVTNETGILVPVKDPDALASATRTLLNDPSRREEMGKKARKRVKKHFSFEEMIRRTLDLYERTLDRVRFV